MTDEISNAVESANKNLDNALTVAVDSLHKIAYELTYGKDMVDTAKNTLTQIAIILKVKQKD